MRHAKIAVPVPANTLLNTDSGTTDLTNLEIALIRLANFAEVELSGGKIPISNVKPAKSVGELKMDENGVAMPDVSSSKIKRRDNKGPAIAGNTPATFLISSSADICGDTPTQRFVLLCRKHTRKSPLGVVPDGVFGAPSQLSRKSLADRCNFVCLPSRSVITAVRQSPPGISVQTPRGKPELHNNAALLPGG